MVTEWTQVIQVLLLILMTASVLKLLAESVHLPYTVLLVFAGTGIYFLRLPELDLFDNQAVTTGIIMNIFLPALVFEAGMNMDGRRLLENIVPVAILASLGVILGTALTATLIWQGPQIPVASALVFGALISATDPIAVTGLFRQMKISRRLGTLLGGESLFNDGIAVVLVTFLVPFALNGHLQAGHAVFAFIFSVSGGLALGALSGFIASRLTARIEEPSVEVTLTTVTAYGTFILGEHLHPVFTSTTIDSVSI